MSSTSNIFTMQDNGLKSTKVVQINGDDKPATFERTIMECGFGKFNLLLILVSLPAVWASIFEITTMSYIFASAQCDLELTLEDKGYLNSITYAGMITSGAIWGFLFDTLGRKRLLICGFLVDGILVVLSSFSQSIIPLMLCKFLGGLVINGPFSAISSYLSEFHCMRFRPRIQLSIGTMNGLGTIALPLLAWAILTRPWEFSLFEGYLEFHPWNVYLFICALPALSSGIIFLLLPESPKFLMTIGQNEKALKVFKKVYRINTGKPEETFPIKELINETTLNDSKYGGQVTANRTKVQAVKEGWQQITPLFHAPMNILRLWLPQIFQAISDYEHDHNGTSTNLCTMLEELKSTPSHNDCRINMDNMSVYINGIIVALATTAGYILTGTVIHLFGKKKILIFLGIIAGTSGFSIYLSHNTITTTVFSALFISLSSICGQVILSVIIDLFPTTLRTLTIALAMMVGRIGAMTGHLLFPILLRTGCGPPFFYIGSLMIGSAFLCTLLPNTDNKDLR